MTYATRQSSAVRTAKQAAIETTIGASPKLYLYDAAPSAAMTDADPGNAIANGTLPTGATVKAGRYAQVEFPAGAGLRGNSYKFRCKGATADAAIAPICPVIVPVV